jgi:hypothetical protein
LIYAAFLKGEKTRGKPDPPTFIKRVNGVFLCLVGTALYWGISQYKATGQKEKVIDFSMTRASRQYKLIERARSYY